MFTSTSGRQKKPFYEQNLSNPSRHQISCHDALEQKTILASKVNKRLKLLAVLFSSSPRLRRGHTALELKLKPLASSLVEGSWSQVVCHNIQRRQEENLRNSLRNSQCGSKEQSS